MSDYDEVGSRVLLSGAVAVFAERYVEDVVKFVLNLPVLSHVLSGRFSAEMAAADVVTHGVLDHVAACVFAQTIDTDQGRQPGPFVCYIKVVFEFVNDSGGPRFDSPVTRV
ncbi:MAG: hypothetical protein ACI81R_000399 [Bradymonadia bacterium]